MKTTKEQLTDLKQALKLIIDAYYLQNTAHCIFYENFKIDENFDFFENDFYKLTRFKTSSELYNLEQAIENLILKIENNNNN